MKNYKEKKAVNGVGGFFLCEKEDSPYQFLKKWSIGDFLLSRTLTICYTLLLSDTNIA